MLLTLVAATTVTLTVPCDTTRNVVSQLQTEFDEQIVWIGQSAEEGVTFSIFENPDGTGWTVVSHNAHGMSCILGVGTDATQTRP